MKTPLKCHNYFNVCAYNSVKKTKKDDYNTIFDEIGGWDVEKSHFIVTREAC